MTTVAIHQPEYLPWLGFLDKARRADVLVLLDSVPFDRASLQHRAKVIGANGLVWLTIPFVHRFPQRIEEVMIADPRWAEKHWKSLEACYGRAPGWETAGARLHALLDGAVTRLVDVSIASVRLLLDAFDATPRRVVRASELAATGDKGELVLAICQELGATRYLSGRSGAAYLDAARFAAHGVEIVVQSFTPPEYPRRRTVPREDDRGISAVDAWCHLGADAPALLAQSKP